MENITLKCRVITPMFMAGADRRGVELRPSEFKGMMRFWWRAIKAEDNIEDLRKKEAEIFGGTGEKEGKSKVKIKIVPESISTGKYWPLPHSGTKKFTFDCIEKDSAFNIVLMGGEKFLDIFRNTFVVSTILGGFGKRSRRGFGSIEIIEPSEFNFEDFEKEEYIEKILEILNQIENRYQIKDSKIVNTKKGGNYPWIKEIEIGRGESDWEKLLKKIGNASHNHKNPSLGNASPRMASPIYVSVIKLKDVYYPIVTTLNSFFPKSYHSFDLNKQNDFKKEVLS